MHILVFPLSETNDGLPPATAVESSGAKGRLWRKFQILASGGHVSGFRFAPPSSGRSAVGPEHVIRQSAWRRPLSPQDGEKAIARHLRY
ncbi:hypothetical protein EHS39_34505 [Ensifer sp. MPMI2T]|nr:hypothetical protein EHS39_34505 [Ensifer sp. MPMI2T]